MATRRITFAALMGFVMAALLPGCPSEPAPAGDKTTVVTIDGRDFELELALDAASRLQGLSDRESIAPDGGMLFVFPDSDERTFVMRKCLVPIDILFLDTNGRVVATHAMEVEPYDTSEWSLKRYSSRWPAQFAIEIQGGMLEQLEVASGDQIALPLESLKNRAR